MSEFNDSVEMLVLSRDSRRKSWAWLALATCAALIAVSWLSQGRRESTAILDHSVSFTLRFPERTAAAQEFDAGSEKDTTSVITISQAATANPTISASADNDRASGSTSNIDTVKEKETDEGVNNAASSSWSKCAAITPSSGEQGTVFRAQVALLKSAIVSSLNDGGLNAGRACESVNLVLMAGGGAEDRDKTGGLQSSGFSAPLLEGQSPSDASSSTIKDSGDLLLCSASFILPASAKSGRYTAWVVGGGAVDSNTACDLKAIGALSDHHNSFELVSAPQPSGKESALMLVTAGGRAGGSNGNIASAFVIPSSSGPITFMLRPEPLGRPAVTLDGDKRDFWGVLVEGTLPSGNAVRAAPRVRLVRDDSVLEQAAMSANSSGKQRLTASAAGETRESSSSGTSAPTVPPSRSPTPTMAPSPIPALYSFTLALPPVPGVNYTMRLFLQQAGFSSQTLTSDTCTGPQDPASLVLIASIGVVDAAAAVPVTIAPDGSIEEAPLLRPAVDTGKKPALVEASSIFTGWYEIPPVDAPFPFWSSQAPQGKRIFEWHSPGRGSDHASGSSGGKTSKGFRYFTPTEAAQCLAGKWLAFLGDSTMEELAISTVLVTGADFNEGWTDAGETGCRSLGFKNARQFDSAVLQPGPALWQAGTRVSMFWSAGERPCKDLSGVATFEDPAWLARALIAHAPDEVNGVKRRPTVIFNSGLHDLANRHMDVNRYTRLMRDAALPFLVGNISGRVIYKTSNPKTGDYACNIPTVRDKVGEAGVEGIDDIALRLINDRPDAPSVFSVLDENALLCPFTEPEQILQHHCSNVLIRKDSTPRALAHVYSGCLATAHALLNLLCPAP